MNLLIFLAVAPGLFLMYQVYKLDKIEKEPAGLLLILFLLGAFLVTMLAVFLESAGYAIVGNTMGNLSELALLVIINFIVVGGAEEGMKYLVLKRTTWNHSAFNYRFDAIVYAVVISIGFAIAENIKYVTSYGFGVAVIRAVTAVPAHTIFAIFMGMYYGQAKLLYNHGHEAGARRMRMKAFFVPAFIHGLYDFLASFGGNMGLLFYVLIIGLEIYAIRLVKKEAREDRNIQ